MTRKGYTDELMSIADDATTHGRDVEAADIRAEVFARDGQPVTFRGKALTTEMRVAIATRARAQQAKRSLFSFFVQAWHVLEPETKLELNWHHLLLCNHVQGQLDDWFAKQKNPAHRMRAQNAIYNFPPGTTKSRIISVMAPAWMWIRRPSWSVLCLSANPFVATRDASFTRDIVTSPWYRQMFDVTWGIRDDATAKGNYKNTAGGSRVSLGLTSRIVGARADCIIIDDPNDMYEVFSEASRREVNGKIRDAIWNRVNDQRSVVRMEMQQRGHVQDATGHLIDSLGTNTAKGGVMTVIVPMDYDPTLNITTPYGYHDPRTIKGQSLHPVRFTAEFLEQERHRLGTFGYNSQYNQKPAPLEGQMFKRDDFRFFKLNAVGLEINPYIVLPPKLRDLTLSSMLQDRPLGTRRRVDRPAEILNFKRSGVSRDAHWTFHVDVDWWAITVDATFGSTTQAASQVGLGVVAGKGALRYVFDDRTAVMDTNQMFEAIRQLIVDYPAARRVLVEEKANGPAIIQLFRKEYSGFIGLQPQGGKVARANAMIPAYESGNVMYLDGAPWLPAHIEELALFDKGPYDDRVDMMSQLMTYAETGLVTINKWEAMSR